MIGGPARGSSGPVLFLRDGSPGDPRLTHPSSRSCSAAPNRARTGPVSSTGGALPHRPETEGGGAEYHGVPGTGRRDHLLPLGDVGLQPWGGDEHHRAGGGVGLPPHLGQSAFGKTLTPELDQSGDQGLAEPVPARHRGPRRSARAVVPRGRAPWSPPPGSGLARSGPGGVPSRAGSTRVAASPVMVSPPVIGWSSIARDRTGDVDPLRSRSYPDRKGKRAGPVHIAAARTLPCHLSRSRPRCCWRPAWP